jgi:hypothetical protein
VPDEIPIASDTSRQHIGLPSLDTIAILNNTQAPLRLEYTFKRMSSDDLWLREHLSLLTTVEAGKAGDYNCPWVLLSPRLIVDETKAPIR